MLILFQFLFLGIAQIVFDSGFFDFFSVVQTGCISTASWQATIPFNSSFAKPPQIILVRQFIDLSPSQSSQLDIQFQLSVVTTNSFQLSVQCSHQQVSRLAFFWYALDDPNVQIINNFNIPLVQNAIFDHQNPKAGAGFISLICLSYTGKFSLNLTISSITSSNVKVSFTDPLSLIGNILSIGYQIILTPPEYIKIIDTIWANTSWTSSYIPIVPNLCFMFPALGYEYENTYDLQIISYPAIVNNSIQYNVIYFFGAYAANTHQQIQFLFPYSKIFCNHFKVIKKVDLTGTLSTSVKILAFETNQQFTSTGQYSVVLYNISTTINFDITVNCLETQNVLSQFFMYISQKKQIEQTQYLHSCSSQYHILTYHVRFKRDPIPASTEQLQIILTSNSLNITQQLPTVINQGIQYQQLAAIQVIAQ